MHKQKILACKIDCIDCENGNRLACIKKTSFCVCQINRPCEILDVREFLVIFCCLNIVDFKEKPFASAIIQQARLD